MANGSPSPGWYEDPQDSGKVRWWDGGQWTQDTQPRPAADEAAAASDPWAAAQEHPEQQWSSEQPQPDQQWGQQPEQQWGQQPAQPEQQWSQQPEQQWGQQPAQPEQQWGQQPEQQWAQQQPEPQWGQQPAQPEQPGPAQWGGQQQPEQQWGQQPAQPEQPGPAQWGQQPAQPEQPGPVQWGQQQPPPSDQAGGWQQAGGPQWGSTVPPAPVPGGLAPGSPMGQTNVFPTAETIDPITGMPIGTGDGDSGSGGSGKRLAALVAGALLVGLLIIGLLWFFLFRDSGSDSGAGTSSGPVNVTATFTGTVDPACSDLGAALTADGLTDTVVNRLNEVAIAKNLEENQAYFTQLGKDIKPIMDQYQSACVAAVAAGNAPEFYRTFVETFKASVSDGAEVATTALGAGGQVPPADAERLRAESSKLSASGQAVMAITGTPTPMATAETTTPGPQESTRSTSPQQSALSTPGPVPSGAAGNPTPSPVPSGAAGNPTP